MAWIHSSTLVGNTPIEVWALFDRAFCMEIFRYLAVVQYSRLPHALIRTMYDPWHLFRNIYANDFLCPVANCIMVQCFIGYLNCDLTCCVAVVYRLLCISAGFSWHYCRDNMLSATYFLRSHVEYFVTLEGRYADWGHCVGYRPVFVCYSKP